MVFCALATVHGGAKSPLSIAGGPSVAGGAERVFRPLPGSSWASGCCVERVSWREWVDRRKNGSL